MVDYVSLILDNISRDALPDSCVECLYRISITNRLDDRLRGVGDMFECIFQHYPNCIPKDVIVELDDDQIELITDAFESLEECCTIYPDLFIRLPQTLQRKVFDKISHNEHVLNVIKSDICDIFEDADTPETYEPYLYEIATKYRWISRQKSKTSLEC